MVTHNIEILGFKAERNKGRSRMVNGLDYVMIFTSAREFGAVVTHSCRRREAILTEHAQ